jgi:hypothetical protein
MVSECWLSIARMTALATVIGWSDGTKNFQMRDLGHAIRENMGVWMCPGITSVVRTLGALYLGHVLSKADVRVRKSVPLVQLVAKGVVQCHESCLGCGIVTELASTNHTHYRRDGDL